MFARRKCVTGTSNQGLARRGDSDESSMFPFCGKGSRASAELQSEPGERSDCAASLAVGSIPSATGSAIPRRKQRARSLHVGVTRKLSLARASATRRVVCGRTGSLIVCRTRTELRVRGSGICMHNRTVGRIGTVGPWISVMAELVPGGTTSSATNWICGVCSGRIGNKTWRQRK